MDDVDINKVMAFLKKVYGKDKLAPFKGKEKWRAYHLAYQKQQELAKVMTDDDFLSGGEATANMVLYRTIMIAWERQLKNKHIVYDFPDPPEIAKGAELSTVSGQVETWARSM